ncbi:hypothetical protein SEUCBS139899_004336 [Sporothrix eucalyptigena]|uniref:Uncharacterized protein n=1 Tax=Sporothrix eucalyptigena TaxID=1812306 RepID=A0ABP0D4Y0_9PEZI
MFNAANTIWQMLSQRSIMGTNDDGDSSTTSSTSVHDYLPTFCDVLVVKTMLQRVGRLPLELVDAIVDDAAYWAHTRVEVDYHREMGHDLNVSSRPTGNQFLIRTPPLGFQRAPVLGDEDDRQEYATEGPEPRPVPSGNGEGSALCSVEDIRGWLPSAHAPLLEHPCRRIVFTIVSHDQGWASSGDRGGYRGSYTWFDVGLERYGWDGEARSQPSPQETAPFAPAAPHTASLYTLRPDVVDAAPPPADHWDHPRHAQPSNQPPAIHQFSFPLLPGVDCLQMNRCATLEFTEHTVVWSWTDKTPRDESVLAPDADADTDRPSEDSTAFVDDPQREPPLDPLQKIGRGSETSDGSFVRNLQVGDVVTVWAKARFPGWINTIRRVQVDVYWAV